ncbi:MULTISPECIES: DUF499 domain-containing protein [Spirulina sp. CCY15215]|uniref:ATP-binding protein n=1 Tax=Spirulina sp. CCY15215 TaxID=2767591 RepID=UPI001951E1E0|nr:DUF499 domain-containing protein [Spirulina major]
MSAYQIKPWTQVVTPHADIRNGNLENAQFGAKLGQVVSQDPHCPLVYRDARQFFAATYLTTELKKLFTTVLKGLCGQGGDRVLQLRTPFGGGKTHSLIGLYHLIEHRNQLGDIPELAQLPQPGKVQVGAFIGQDTEVTTGANIDGQTLLTPWGVLAWRMGGRDAYEIVRENDEKRVAPGGDTLRQLIGDRPTLFLLDEFLLYIDNALGVPVGESTLGRQVLGFVQKLTEAVSGLPNAVMVYSLQSSVQEALTYEGLLDTLDKLVSRLDAKKEPVSGDEVMKVVQRRLFETVGDPDTIREVAQQQGDLFRKFQNTYAETERDRKEIDQQAQILAERIEFSYPFHPDLLDLMYLRWGSLPSYQRTRGALQFLARAIAILWERQDNAWLITPGDIPIDDPDVKSIFYAQVGERKNAYDAVLSADLTGRTAKVKRVNQRLADNSPHLASLNVGSRLATAILLYSFGAKQGEDRGVEAGEVAAACLSPSLDRTTLTATLSDLRDELLYLHYAGRRYRFETQPNLNKLIADELSRVDRREVLDLIRQQLEQGIQKKPGQGRVVLWPQDAGRIGDRLTEFTVAYLDPAWAEKDQQMAIDAAMLWLDTNKREYKNALAFVVPNAQQMETLRQEARTELAIASLLEQGKKYKFVPDDLEELKDKRKEAQTKIEAAIRRLYDYILIPMPAPAENPPLRMECLDLQSQLNTSVSWQQRITEALKGHVFDSVTVNRLLRLNQLDRADAQYLQGKTVINGAFIYPSTTKFWTDAPIKKAILKAIASGQLGYTPTLVIASDGTATLENPKQVYINQEIPPDEFDPDGYLLTPSLVEQLLAPFQTTPPSTAETVTESDRADMDYLDRVRHAGESEGKTNSVADESQQYKTEKTSASTIERSVLTKIVEGKQIAKHYQLSSITDKAKLFELFSVLQLLSDKADEMMVTIEVRAHTQAEFDPNWIRNAIEEVLDESDISATTRLE